MATFNIISPHYSFVKFDSPELESCCLGDETFCLPVVEENDTYFQFSIDADTYISSKLIDETPLANIQLLLLDGTGNDADSIAANTLRNWTVADSLNFEKYRTSFTRFTFLWRNIFKDIATLLACDQCFQLAIVATLNDGETPQVFKVFSNCFVKKCSDCYTSVLEYTNDEDAYDFNYCNITNPVNRVRLPLYFSRPQFPDEESVYVKSDGTIVMLKSVSRKEYPVQTEHFPEHIHEKLKVALGHDYDRMVTGNYIGNFRKTGGYEVEWDDEMNLCKAPAKFKAAVTPYAVRNNNCQDCEELDECTEISVPAFTLPDADLGTPYSFSVDIIGYLPIILSDIVKPDLAWMTVAISGSTLSFTGTPDAEGNALEVSFTLTNECAESTTISKTINIENMVPGFIMEWGGLVSSIPDGWLLCDGAPVSRATYAPLFAVLGELHGAGDGTTTFNLPTIKQQTVVGYDAATSPFDTVGTAGGLNEVTLGVGQLPKFRVKLFADAEGVEGGANDLVGFPDRRVSVSTNDDSNRAYRMLSTASNPEATLGESSEIGNDEPVSVMQAFVVLPYIIKY